jgi:solute:Na+ symporter, SSS family
VTSIDFLITFSYLAATVAIGIVYRGKQDDTRDYFISHRGFGGMIGTALIGLSIAATLLSGLSFVAFPSIAFTFGITVLSGTVVWPLLYVLMRFWFLPRYLAVAQTSPYEIIERRFGISVRITASAMFVACRLCWMSAVIYVPALLLTSGGLLDPIWFWPLVALIGISSTLYTVIGWHPRRHHYRHRPNAPDHICADRHHRLRRPPQPAVTGRSRHHATKHYATAPFGPIL